MEFALQDLILKSKQKFDPFDFIQLANSLCKALLEYHRLGKIHYRLRPDAFLVSKNTHGHWSAQIKMPIPHVQTSTIEDIEQRELQRCIHYISPEQTNTINPRPSLQNDLYALGIILYELATGTTPCQETAIINIIHHHVAISPSPPSTHNSRIPKAIDACVMKLLSKNPDNRYKSARGLIKDLDKIIELNLYTQLLSRFQPGIGDHSETLQFSNRLHGRASDLKKLHDAYKDMAHNKIILLSGNAGVGKTALVKRFRSMLNQSSIIYMEGTFDQFSKGTPYSAIAIAFRGLVIELLSFKTEKLENWLADIKIILGDKANLMIQIIPELELVLGQQPSDQTTATQITQAEITSLMSEVIQLFTRSNKKFILFLDDLNWADHASLHLIASLINDQRMTQFLFITTQKNDGIALDSTLTEIMEQLKNNHKSTLLHIEAIHPEEIEDILIETLHSSRNKIRALAILIFNKTGGNPFFIRQFITTLYERKLLYYDYNCEAWCWAIERIQHEKVTDNIVELITHKILSLSKVTQHALHTAALLGSSQDIRFLAQVLDQPKQQVLHDIEHAVQDEFILINQGRYTFLHDRIQEACYSIIPIENRPAAHLHAARRLSSKNDKLTLYHFIFDIARHYLNAIDLLTDEQERIDVIDIFRQAADKAIASTLWVQARLYCNSALSLLPADAWILIYDLTWHIHKNKAYCEFALGTLSESEKYCHECLSNSQTNTHKIELHRLYSKLLFQMNRHFESYANTRTALSILELKLPATVSKLNVFASFLHSKIMIGHRKPMDLMEIGACTNESAMQIYQVIYESAESNYLVNLNAMAYLALKMVMTCLIYGHSKYSGFAFELFALLISRFTKNYRLANEYSKLAIHLCERYPDNNVKGQVLMITAGRSHHWFNPIHEEMQLYREATRLNLQAGNAYGACYSKVISTPNRILFNTLPLDKVLEENQECLAIFERQKNQEAINMQIHLMRFGLLLAGKPLSVAGHAHWNDVDYTRTMKKPGNTTVRIYYYYFEALFSFLKRDLQSAHTQINKAIELLPQTLGNLIDPPTRLLFVLIQCARFHEEIEKNKVKILIKIRQQRIIISTYAKNNPTEFTPFKLIVQAEEQRIINKKKAGTLYELALDSVNIKKYYFLIVLFNDLAAQYYLDIGSTRLAKHYAQLAIQAYNSWGATTGAIFLQKRFQPIFDVTQDTHKTNNIKYKFNGHLPYSLDTDALIHATQIISMELNFDQLINKLLELIISVIGAQYGVVVLNTNKKLEVKTICKDTCTIAPPYQHDTTENISTLFSIAVTRYVMKTSNLLILGCAHERGDFTQDPYILSKKSNSIMGMPLKRKGGVIGAIFLEHQLPNIFNKSHKDIAEMLLIQASISLENASLFKLKEKNENELRQLQRAVEQTPSSIIITDNSGRIEYVNPYFESLYLIEEESLTGRLIYQLDITSIEGINEEQLNNIVQYKKIWRGESLTKSRDGSDVWESISLSPILNEQQQVCNLLIIKEDITAQKQQQEEILHQKHYDALTDLPNRSLAIDRLRYATSLAKQKRQNVAICFVGLDNFKKINDAQGHDTGDQLLKRASQRLQQCVRLEDTVARQGGDEFIVILTELDNVSNAKIVVEKILTEFRAPFSLQQLEFVLTVSIGISMFPQDGATEMILLQHANAAMSQAKEKGRNSIQFYNEKINTTIVRRLELELLLLHALENEEFYLEYQPLMDALSGKILGAEALLRWNHPKIGLVHPEEFIPIAEHLGIINSIGAWVLEKACHQVKLWHKSQHRFFNISVNISPAQFRNENIVQTVQDILHRTGLDAKNLTLEVTEGIFMDLHCNVLQQLTQLSHLGIQLSMDDFGTGYSSLSYLSQFSFNKLKIDKSFVQKLTRGRKDRAIVLAAIKMAHSLELLVVAEGVESQYQYDFLRDHGCEYIQGYYISKPLKLAQFEAMLESHCFQATYA